MFSYINLFISFLILLQNDFDFNFNLKNNIYCLIITSFVLAYTTQGFISLLVVSIGISKFPIIIISSFLLLLTILVNKIKSKKIFIFKNFISSEINHIKKDYKNNSKIILFLVLLLINLIIISSIGPINHPDALDYHVGYPYQYWLRGKFIIDGGLHQAVLGIGDYANLSFIQEKTIWLIRTLQIINLPIIVFFLYSKLKNKTLILIFLTSPVFIQWATVGKPLFLVESACAVNFIIWQENKDSFSRKLLLVSLLASISVKISAIIICLPIIIELIRDLVTTNQKNTFQNDLKNLVFCKYIFLELFILFSILLSRQIIAGNFAFPLFTELFNKDNNLLINFAKDLSSYQRDGLFPVNIFFPISLSDLSSSLGPAILIIIIISIYINIKNKNFIRNPIFNIGVTQVILLILFCQGRGDYYVCPLIIFTYLSKEINKNLLKPVFIFFKNSLNLTIIVQSFLIFIFLFFSIFQSIHSIFDYENAMKNISYGYESSLPINRNINGNIFHNVGRNVRFYYPENYVDRDKFNECLIKNKQQTCFKEYDINQIIAPENYILDKSEFKCKKKLATKGSRNPLNRKKEMFEICER